MPSSATISGVAVLENPRAIPNTNTIIFDSQMYLASSEPATVGSLRYFNENKLEFAPVSCCSVVIHAARISPDIEVFSDKLAAVDYHLFGDIISLIPFGLPENFTPKYHPFVSVCGAASNVDKQNSSFDITAEQYLSANKAYNNQFPVHFVFPDTPRWQNKKPLPGPGKPVVVDGFLTGVERNPGRTVKHFIIDIEKVTFVGQGTSAPKAEPSPVKLKSDSGASALMFTGFDVVTEQQPAPKKRKITLVTTDDHRTEQPNNRDDDKDEGSSTGGRRRQRQ
ncbi:hypothetical protein R3P38DRAFT_2629104 [Favolaschia claudopus]|uniref:Uncharacterized protein n=1 Tax=Favolaschia claudopus TaxID=2862362 RepID=A0AAW0B6Y9_9AGAR